jgi:small redox-active disulfide protein 2
MDIKVLGTGCARCRSLEKTVKEAVAALKLDIKVEEIKDIQEIMQYQILMTPGLVINGKVVMSGKVPSRAEIERLITEAIHTQG